MFILNLFLSLMLVFSCLNLNFGLFNNKRDLHEKHEEQIVFNLKDSNVNTNINNNITLDNSKSVNINDNNNNHINKVEEQHHQKYSPHLHHNNHSNKSNTRNQQKLNNNRPPKKENKDELLVNTENGYVRGRAFYLDHHLSKHQKSKVFPYGRKKYRVNAWLGIPFAEKPIGDLRFKRPVPVKNWDGVYNATELPNTCVQLEDTVIPNFWGVDMWNPNTNVSEDCLYLNVWTPHPKPKNSAVMVWIYGGGFATGTSTLKIYDPRIIVAETQLIFVSLQYRLSIFGFLYLNHENAPGNQGLLDQNLALKWIHNNIQYFGGDSSKITIVGESAGSVSVSYHLVSPLSHNLFRNAILESGTVLADWTLLKETDAVKRNTELVMSLGCNGTAYELIECAKKVDARTAIEKADETFYTKANHGVAQYTFLPVVDNFFLEEEPITLLNRGKFKKCPILIGANKDEGNWFFVYAFPEYRNLTSMPIVDYDLFKDFLLSLFYYYPQYPSTASSAVLDAIKYRYTNWNNVHNSIKNIENLDDAAGDFHFLCPAVDFANIYAMNQLDVYFYHYTQRSSRHVWPDWLGVLHADEISFVFGEPLYPEFNFTHTEKVLAKKILKYWSNFVKYSDPNDPIEPDTSEKEEPNSQTATVHENLYNNSSSLNSTSRYKIDKSSKYSYKTQTLMQHIETWPKYRVLAKTEDDYQRAYLVLNSEKVEVNYNLRAEYCTFWGSYLPKMVLTETHCDCGNCPNTRKETIKLVEKSSASSITGVQPLKLSVFMVFIVKLRYFIQ